MYYQTPSVIEQDDIQSVESLGLEQTDAEPRLHVILRLRPDRTYIPEKGLLLYLTDGVHHRLLTPEQYVDVATSASTAARKKQFQPAATLAQVEQQMEALSEELKTAQESGDGQTG